METANMHVMYLLEPHVRCCETLCVCVRVANCERGKGKESRTIAMAVDDAAFEPWLYYWDARDGPVWTGWWIAPAVASDCFLAFSQGAPDAVSIPESCIHWHGGDGPIDMWVKRLDDVTIGVRAPGLGFQGAFEQSHPENHGQPVYKWVRELDAAEVIMLDQAKSATEIVTYTRDLALVGFRASPPAPTEPIVGVAVGSMGAQSALNWVMGDVVQGIPMLD